MNDKINLINSLKSRGFSSKILKAFRKVHREEFLPEGLKDFAYYDSALPIGEGATISQPYTIAFMLNLLELKIKQKILEIGSGSGYVLALLSEITNGEIYGVEINKSLAVKSKKALLHYRNVKIFCKNGFNGLPKMAQFDRILISASMDEIPLHLVSQIKNAGIIVCPVENSIFKIKKKKILEIEEFPGFVFVQLKRKN